MDKTEEQKEDGEKKNYVTKDPRSLYSSADITRMSKQRMLRWAGYVAGTEEFIIAYKFVGKIERRKTP